MKTEKINIHWELSTEARDKHKAELAIIYKGREGLPKVFSHNVKPGDTFHCSYQLIANYHGNMSECLSAVKRICESPELVVRVDCAALKKQRILIYETLKSLDALIQTVDNR